MSPEFSLPIVMYGISKLLRVPINQSWCRRRATDETLRIGRWTGRPVALIALASSHRRRRIMLTTRLNCTSKTGLCGFLLDGRNLALFDAVREKSPAMHTRMRDLG